MARHAVLFERAEDGSWGGYFPEIPTILVNGLMLEEARENARTGLAFWIEGMKKDGWPLPEPHMRAFEIEAAA